MAENTKLTLAASTVLYNLLEKLLYNLEDIEGKKTIVERKIPFNVKYKIQRDKTALSRDWTYVENARRTAVEKYGEKTGETITVSDANLEVFNNEMKELLKIEVEHNFSKFTPSEVESLALDVDDVSTAEIELFVASLVEDPDLEKDMNTEIPKPAK